MGGGGGRGAGQSNVVVNSRVNPIGGFDSPPRTHSLFSDQEWNTIENFVLQRGFGEYFLIAKKKVKHMTFQFNLRREKKKIGRVKNIINAHTHKE